jgi:cellulose synthase/poly-beta-1,6-N-acetylglucosamine synthase-like glycosyltransferase
MTVSIFHSLDIILWCIMAASTAYILFYAIASLFRRQRTVADASAHQNRFLILFPAYQEDEVIIPAVKTFLQQRYPATHYSVAVISDHIGVETNRQLAALPITLLQPQFDSSSKAKAMQYAISHGTANYDKVVILDADNMVEPDFLTRLNDACNQGYEVIQCHRCAKNTTNEIAVLDSLSEEINNTLFRRAHNQVGLSSALIGSGMCFPYRWFAAHVNQLSTAGEDRELEAMLVRENIYIHFEESILVRDEKVSSEDSFQKQRLRWMTAQVQSLFAMLPYLPKAIRSGNINYIDKTWQQALIPRSILIVATLLLAVISLCLAPSWSIKWWILFCILCLVILIAIPPSMRKAAILSKMIYLPKLVWRMFSNISKIDRHNTEFIHTEHKNQN